MSRFFASGHRGIWSIVAAATLWGTTGVCTQAIYHFSSTNALSVAFLRLAIGALVLFLLCWRTLGKTMWRVGRRDALLMGFLGVMQAIFQYSYLAAIPFCGVTIATLIAICVAPVVVVFCSIFFLREQVSLKILISLLCALVGTALLTGYPGGARGQTAQMLIGVLLSLICAVSYAAVIIGGRSLSHKVHALQTNAASFGLGALLLGISSLATGSLVATYPAPSWLLLIYMGCIPTALAYALFQSGMRTTSATLTSILTQVEPLTAALLAWLIFGERLSLFGLFGALLLLSTIFALTQEGKS